MGQAGIAMRCEARRIWLSCLLPICGSNYRRSLRACRGRRGQPAEWASAMDPSDGSRRRLRICPVAGAVRRGTWWHAGLIRWLTPTVAHCKFGGEGTYWGTSPGTW